MKELGDFSAGVRLLWIAAVAVVVGALCAFVAVALLWLIGFFTNLFYHCQIASFQPTNLPRPVGPAEYPFGYGVILVPVLGGLIIGLMARYGSDRIRGHGIPEAMEAILIGQSRMRPKVAILKPLSSAVSIGSGGPFGAEGPIIMTGGAFGSIIAQAFHMTAAERKTLLVAGAAGGMSATFATPIAAVLLAVELLLFEWKPRSLVPVAVASVVAALIRPYVLGGGPLFHMAPLAGQLSLGPLLFAVVVGVAAGVLSLTLTVAVYAAEDAFYHVPIHWMWWPAIGGLVVGIGGIIQPRALGVGYDIIEELLQGQYVIATFAGLLVVKALIWSISLGSGTSGGVLAPLLIMGGVLGAALGSTLLPDAPRGLWPLVGMAAVLGGTMRCPLTGAIFALELTHEINALPALFIASVISYGFTVLVMKRSILTEKVARRGYHVSREYSVDPLERLLISEVMTTDVVTVPAAMPVKEVVREYFLGGAHVGHQGYPVVDENGHVLGIITKSNLMQNWVIGLMTQPTSPDINLGPIIAYDLIQGKPITVYATDLCRTAAERMAQSGVGRVLVVSPEEPDKLIGIVTRSDLLKARGRAVEEEEVRERFLGTGFVPPGARKNV